MTAIRVLTVLAIVAIFGALASVEIAVRTVAKGISSIWRRWQTYRHDQYWGLGSYDEDAQEYVKARLRCDAARRVGVSEQQWAEFVEAHPVTTEEAS